MVSGGGISAFVLEFFKALLAFLTVSITCLSSTKCRFILELLKFFSKLPALVLLPNKKKIIKLKIKIIYFS